VKYTTKERLNLQGKKCVAPFIEESNVWDIPVKNYTSEVESAIKSAYMIGVRHTINKVENFMKTRICWEKFE